MSATLPPKRATDARVADATVASMFVERWSRRAFAERPLSQEHVRSLFEAARWTPSASNLQPWLFIYADDPESLARTRPILFDSNRRWADRAPLLVFAFARNRHPTRDVVNHTSAFDSGAAWMAMALQAHALGLICHAMGGFHHELAHETLGVPRSDYTAYAAIAVGHPGDPEQLPDDLKARELPSARKPVSEFAFKGSYQPAGVPDTGRRDHRAAEQALRSRLSELDESAILGWKVAVNFPAFQARLGLSGPVVAPLVESAQHESGSAVQFGPDSQVFVEAEIGARFGRQLRDASNLDQLRGSIVEYRPCLELLDYARPRGDLRELFQHAFFHAGIVLGRVVTAEQVAALSAGLPRAVGADGQTHARLDFAVPSDVMVAVQRAVELILSAGGSVRSGQLLLCGSYIEPVALPHGASVRAEYGFAQVEVRRPA